MSGIEWIPTAISAANTAVSLFGNKEGGTPPPAPGITPTSGVEGGAQFQPSAVAFAKNLSDVLHKPLPTTPSQGSTTAGVSLSSLPPPMIGDPTNDRLAMLRKLIG